MKSFTQFLNESKKPKTDTYYEVGGDPYDMGVILNVYVKGKEVFHTIRNGTWDWKYKGKEYKILDKLLDAVGKDHGGLKAKDFERIEWND